MQNETSMLDTEFLDVLQSQLQGKRKITFLVGAGLSAESGIPTFRDADGFWTIGSKNYTPQEMGTLQMFNVNAHQVWNWYLYRIHLCQQARPNPGHFALANIQQLIPDRFALISQNVDGLHFQTPLDLSQLYLIHGDLRYMRCSADCGNELYPIPIELLARGEQTHLHTDEVKLLSCPKCGELTRPHVLWFDEYYNQKFYKLDSVLRIAKETSLLFLVGTSGATNLPKRIVDTILAKSSVVVDINPRENEFTHQLERAKNGYWIQGKSGEVLPMIEAQIHLFKSRES